MFNSLSCFSDTYLIIYRKRKNKKSRERGQTKQEEREPGRRMPPTYRQFIASPSAPSDVLTVRTIASRSPGRTTNKGEGRAGTLTGSGWMSSPPHRHRSTSNQTGIPAGCLSFCPPRLSSVPSAILTVRTIASHSPGRTTNKGEGRAGTLPGSGWMPSPPPLHHLATDRSATRRAAPRAVCHPARLVLFPVLFSSIRW